MENIYASLKNVFHDIKQETQQNKIFLPLLLVVWSIPLPFAINNIALGLLVITALITFRKENISFQKQLFYPIALYILMCISLLWSIDFESTKASLSKEIPFLLLPIVFLISKEFTKEQRDKIIKYFSYSMVLYSLYFLIRAVIRFSITGDHRAFFYHGEENDDYGLVPKLLNAIHVSIYVAIAFFYFFKKTGKKILDYAFLILLFVMVFLLSSKNIIVVFTGLLLVHYLFLAKISRKMRLRNLILFLLFLCSLSFVGKIRERFLIEYETNMADSTVNDVISKGNEKVYNVSIKQALTNETFKPNDYFPGTAFRVYQFRIFIELVKENNTFFTGFGQDASYEKIKEKAIQYNIYMGDASNNYEGYQNKNFHNQYVQIFADIGFFGFILLLVMLVTNVLKALKNKDFVHFAFAFLMISLFLTESFLLRQRGVVFFVTMYCLFNSRFLMPNSPKE